MKLPWVLRVLWQPDVELDLRDTQGKPDHGKQMGFLAFLVFTVLLAIHVLPASVAVVIVLICAAFGPLMFRTFLRSRSGEKDDA